jgi:hypothetical protein
MLTEMRAAVGTGSRDTRRAEVYETYLEKRSAVDAARVELARMREPVHRRRRVVVSDDSDSGSEWDGESEASVVLL